MRKTRIAIIIEVKKRELPFLSILTKMLLIKGYNVKLIPFCSMCSIRLLKFRPDIVVINGLRTTNPCFYSQIFLPKRFFSSKIICMYAEQLGYYNQSIAMGYKNPTILENIDFHIAWGKHFANDLIKMGVPETKVAYIGSMQYDIPFYLKNKSDEIKKDLSKKYNLPYDAQWVIYADNIIKQFQPKELYATRRQETIELVTKSAEKNPNAVFIFRPHPATSQEEIHDLLKDLSRYKNIHMISESHILYWTMAASAMIVWCSTSSLQAMFLNKPVFGYITSDKQNMEKYWYKDIFPTFENSEDLSLALTDCLNHKHSYEMTEIQKNFVEDWYYKQDGKSFQRFCDIVEKVNLEQFTPLVKNYPSPVKPIFVKLFLEIKAAIGDVVLCRKAMTQVFDWEVEDELKKYDLSLMLNEK